MPFNIKGKRWSKAISAMQKIKICLKDYLLYGNSISNNDPVDKMIGMMVKSLYHICWKDCWYQD